MSHWVVFYTRESMGDSMYPSDDWDVFNTHQEAVEYARIHEGRIGLIDNSFEKEAGH